MGAGCSEHIWGCAQNQALGGAEASPICSSPNRRVLPSFGCRVLQKGQKGWTGRKDGRKKRVRKAEGTAGQRRRCSKEQQVFSKGLWPQRTCAGAENNEKEGEADKLLHPDPNPCTSCCCTKGTEWDPQQEKSRRDVSGVKE